MENKEEAIEKIAGTNNRLKLNLLSNTLPILLKLEEIGGAKLSCHEHTHGTLWRLAAAENQVTTTTNIAAILDRNELFIMEDMLDNNNGKMFCFGYEDETYLIKRERSFVSIQVKGLINHVSDLKPIADIIETYKQSCGEIYYILKGAVGTTVEIAFVTPNHSSPNTYLNIGLITMDIGNTSQEEDLDIYGSALLEEGRLNLVEAKSYIKSRASHLLQKFNEYAATVPEYSSDSNFEVFEILNYSEDLIKKFLEVAQPSLAYGIDLDLVEILDSTLVNELKLEPLAGTLGNKLVMPNKQDVYMFCLYLLILNSSVIEACGAVSGLINEIGKECGDDNKEFLDNKDNIKEVAIIETDKIFNKALIKTKDFLSLAVAGSKNVGGLDLSIKDAVIMLRAFNNIVFKFDKFMIVDTDKPYYTLYSMLLFTAGKLNTLNTIQDAIYDTIERYLEASKIEVVAGDGSEAIQPEPLEETKEISEAFVTTGEQEMIAVDNEINGLPADNINTPENKFDDEILEADDNETLGHTSKKDEELTHIIGALDTLRDMDMSKASVKMNNDIAKTI